MVQIPLVVQQHLVERQVQIVYLTPILPKVVDMAEVIVKLVVQAVQAVDQEQHQVIQTYYQVVLLAQQQKKQQYQTYQQEHVMKKQILVKYLEEQDCHMLLTG